MLSLKCWFATFNYKDSIYVFGGALKTAETSLKSLKMYSLVDDKWPFTCSMQHLIRADKWSVTAVTSLV